MNKTWAANIKISTHISFVLIIEKLLISNLFNDSEMNHVDQYSIPK